MAIETIGKAAPPGHLPIFRDSQRLDVAHAALIEIAGAGMMGCVGTSPAIVRRQSQDAQAAADPVVGGAVGEEGAVAAIVLDHEDAHQKAGGRKDEDQTPPMAIGIGSRGQGPQRGKRDEGDGKFDGAAPPVRFLVARQDLQPGTLAVRYSFGGNHVHHEA